MQPSQYFPSPLESKERVTPDSLRRTPSSFPVPSENKERGGSIPLRRTPSSFPLPSESKERIAPESLGRKPSSFPISSESKEWVASEPLRQTPPPKTPADRPIKRIPQIPPWWWVLALGLIALAGIGVYLMNLPRPIQEIGALSIQTKPAGATILLDGKPPQVPPNTFTHVPFGPHQLSATLNNYQPMKENIQVRGGMNPDIRLQLKPIQEIAALTIQVEPAGASILLDGKPPQVPPNTFTHVPFGPHQVSAALDGYEPLKQDIQVREGMGPDIRLQLKPIQEIATLSVQSDPPVPQSSWTESRLRCHQTLSLMFRSALTRFPPLWRTLNRSGRTFRFGKERAPKSICASDQFRKSPRFLSKAIPPVPTILLDGKPPQVPPNTFTHVSFGPHQISAALEDFEPFRQDIQVQKGTSPEIRLHLRPIQEIASLSVQTDPVGATILLDGKPPQVPPNTFTHVSFGPHQISATLEDYEPFRQDIQVRKGTSPEIRLHLRPIQEIAALSVLKRSRRCRNPPGRKAASGATKHVHSRFVRPSSDFRRSGGL